MFVGRPSGRLSVRCIGPLTPQICTIFFIQIPSRLFESYVYHVAADKFVNLPTKMAASSVERR